MPDIVSFTFLGTGYFCIPVNIVELCSEIELLGNSLILLRLLLLQFVRQDHSSLV